ncbi:GreA/GreB family elongation factor [Kitasatospora viridis]|uniref:Transcription elongation GreA/GreB family factor n=1 Tax=Kitasatospora viridis TaxID=281105 RepID=A0A561S991_9ACTN|nr:GreA/GreB family elongation factor [Kitasatospora viridis]TWF71438.1 transcription elongation GreA/GreB family factor [Kitasatospora viridis]
MTGLPEPIADDARRALEQELAQLRAERAAVGSTLRGHDADEVGDQADQADELQRADQANRLDRRIAELQVRLEQAAVAGPPRTDAIGVGTSLTVRFDDGTTRSVQIGELANELDDSLVTSDSPLGLALLGHRAGDTVRYTTPVGNAAAEVLSIDS